MRLQASVRLGSLVNRLDLATALLPTSWELVGRLALVLALRFAFAFALRTRRAQRWRRHAEEIRAVPPKGIDMRVSLGRIYQDIY